jgi:hypothetical protein
MDGPTDLFSNATSKTENPQEAHSQNIPIRAIRAENNFIKGAVDL